MLVPFSTVSIDFIISLAVFWAALALSSARLLTSCATTEKPLPASPARAASIAAFKDKRLVCSAISSMLLIMSPIFAEPALISDIAWIIDCICWLQASAFFSASKERRFALEALSAVSLTCSETLAMLAVSSSNTLAWSVVLSARFLAPCEVPSE